MDTQIADLSVHVPDLSGRPLAILNLRSLVEAGVATEPWVGHPTVHRMIYEPHPQPGRSDFEFTAKLLCWLQRHQNNPRH